MSRRFTVQQVLDEIFSGAQEEQEDEDVSEEEDGEEYNPEDDASSDEEEAEIPQETFLSKNSKIAWSSSNSDSNQGRTAAPNIIRMTPGPTRYSAAHVQDIHLSPVHYTSHQKNHPGEYKFEGFLEIWRKLEKYG